MNMTKKGLCKVITDYLSAQLQGELDRLLDNGTLSDMKIEDFRSLHERMPYHKTSVPC